MKELNKIELITTSGGDGTIGYYVAYAVGYVYRKVEQHVQEVSERASASNPYSI